MWFQLRLQITSGNEWFHSDEADFYRAQNWLCKEMELVLVTPALCIFVQGAPWAAPLARTPSLVSPVWALCKLLKVPFVTKIDRHFRLKIAISSQVG